MNRTHKSALLVVGLALPAAAFGAFAPKDNSCFASGSATYRIASGTAAADFRVRIVGAASHPDLRMRLVDRPEAADFVLVDDFSGSPADLCRAADDVKTVRLDAGAAHPDVTVALSGDDGPADYKLYVHSARVSQRDAAALLAAMWSAEHRREITSSLVR